MTARKKLVVVTVAWGDWHLGTLLDYALPSLMAPGNFPALARYCDIEHLIMTRPAERARIEASPAVRKAREFMSVLVAAAVPAEIDPNVNIFNLHHVMWNFANDRAKQTGSYVFNLPPDSIFADGAGATWAKYLTQDKASIFWIYPRAADSASQELRDHVTTAGTLVIAPRDLVALNLRHLHPISRAFFADSDHFPTIHPEMIIWPVDEKGLLLRGFVGEGRLFDPNRVKLSDQQIMTGGLDRREHAVIGDSDELYTIALAPQAHNAEWYRQAGHADAGAVGRWWLGFDGTSNDLVASRQVRIHVDECDEAAWRPRELRANLFMSQAAVSREFFRLARAAFEAGCTWTAALLTMAARIRAAVRAFPRPIRALVFAPTDEAVSARSIGDLLRPSAARSLGRLMRCHVAMDDSPDIALADRIDRAGGDLRLRSLAGEELALRRQGNRLTVNGFLVKSEPGRIGSHTLIPIEGCLEVEATPAIGDEAKRIA